MKKILLINTSSNKQLAIGLITGGSRYWIKRKIRVGKAQMTLSFIDKLLKKHKVKLEDIEEIEVNTTPGSFTGLRVGMAIGNALAFVLGIPVNGKKVML